MRYSDAVKKIAALKHKVTSVYGRRSIDNYIRKAETEGRLIKSKEEIPQGIPQVQYKGNINETSSANSISRDSQNVNKNFSENKENLPTATPLRRRTGSCLSTHLQPRIFRPRKKAF